MKQVVVMDFNDIYAIDVDDGACSNDVLTAYQGQIVVNPNKRYVIRKHSDFMYSVQARDSTYLVTNTIDIAAWWALAYPILEQIAAVTGALSGVAVIGSAPFVFIKWLRKKCHASNSINERQVVRTILSKDRWNLSELSEQISFTKEETRSLLKGFGYVWNPQGMLYVSIKQSSNIQRP